MRLENLQTGEPYVKKSGVRYDEAGHAREFTFSCYRRFAFLKADRTRIWFLEELGSARKKWSFDLWAYVIMPEHIHLLICPRGSATEAGRIAGRLKEAVARRAIAYLASNAPHWLPRIEVREGNRIRHRFWQPGGGYDRNVIDVETAYAMIEYIHANPVRRGLVTRVEDWEWSSARWYAGVRPVRIEMDTTIPQRLGSARPGGSRGGM